MAETKQDILNDITDFLGLRRYTVSVGSSLPSEVFEAAARYAKVGFGSMPEINESIIRKAGMVYEATYDSRNSPSGGGSTVTLDGIRALRQALLSIQHEEPK